MDQKKKEELTEVWILWCKLANVLNNLNFKKKKVLKDQAPKSCDPNDWDYHRFHSGPVMSSDVLPRRHGKFTADFQVAQSNSCKRNEV